jgi:5,10-methylenetetrahydrofolate reductase
MAGIIPLKSAGMAKFMNEKVPGIAVPQSHIDALAAAKEAGQKPGLLGIQMAAELIAQIREEKLCSGVHIMAIGAEENVPKILRQAGITE